ncbi:MAG: sigma-70 family RNA polymerase sigma factor [Acidobacteriia bacterium]|nr:sigma-70 family RNA polymerase sigma factor [Terriglobia bacterium]
MIHVSFEGVTDFPTTRISLVRAAAGGSDRRSREALATLCGMYWYPLYAYVRRCGHDADEAQDLTQSFIVRLLEKNSLRHFQQERGRFRSFLLASLKHFLANERDAVRAQKRGGGLAPLPLNVVLHTGERRYSLEPRDEMTPQRVFEKHWAWSLLNRVLDRLREEAAGSGKGEQFDRLRGCLTGDDNGIGYRDLARELGMSEGAVKVAVHRLRHRFHEALREEISITVTDPNEISEEIRYLLTVLGT